MKNLILCLFVIFAISCKNVDSKTSSEIAQVIPEVPSFEFAITPKNNPNIIKSAHYNIDLVMRNIEDNLYDFEIAVELKNDAHFVSPNSKGDFTGVFSLVINEENKLKRVSKLLESPLSVEEFDPHPFVNGNVNWVRENTTYNQKLQRISNKDFQVNGYIQFTIEPSCTLEKIPFVINNENGKMKVEIDNC